MLILWDEAVYIGIGKYIMTNGAFGIYESFRPIPLAIILGIV